MISVVLPVYNRARTVGRAIESVLSQSHSDLELIVVDDASTDNLAEIIQRFSDRRIRYIRRERNGGAAAARNTGIQHARGEFIAFQDSDDLWLPEKLIRQYALLSMAPACVGVVIGKKIVYGLDAFFISGRDRVSIAPASAGTITEIDDPLGIVLLHNRISVQCCLFRRTCRPDHRWFDECATANEDWGLAIRLARNTRFIEMDEPVVLGFTSVDSISQSNRKQAVGTVRVLKANRDLERRYPDQFAHISFSLGRALTKLGKRRVGRGLVLSALARHPSLVLTLIKRKIRSRLYAIAS